MNRLRVKIPENLLNEFTTKALATKKEVLALLVGDIKKDKVVIDEFYYPNTKANPYFVYEKDEGRRPKRIRNKVIGSLHSHPGEYFTFVSSDDIDSAIHANELVFGVCTLPFGYRKKKHPKVKFNWYSITTKVEIE